MVPVLAMSLILLAVACPQKGMSSGCKLSSILNWHALTMAAALEYTSDCKPGLDMRMHIVTEIITVIMMITKTVITSILIIENDHDIINHSNADANTLLHCSHHVATALLLDDVMVIVCYRYASYTVVTIKRRRLVTAM